MGWGVARDFLIEKILALGADPGSGPPDRSRTSMAGGRVALPRTGPRCPSRARVREACRARERPGSFYQVIKLPMIGSQTTAKSLIVLPWGFRQAF
jgi:hypothetical protein